MVGVAALVAAGVHADGCYYVGWIIRFLRTRRKSRSPVVAQTELSRLFVMWDDAKLLCHVRWEVAASRGMESRRSSTLRVFLALAIGKFSLRECCRAQIRATKTGFE